VRSMTDAARGLRKSGGSPRCESAYRSWRIGCHFS
jgi:hypothetical protein